LPEPIITSHSTLPCIVAKQQKASIYIYVDGNCTIGGWKQELVVCAR